MPHVQHFARRSEDYVETGVTIALAMATATAAFMAPAGSVNFLRRSIGTTIIASTAIVGTAMSYSLLLQRSLGCSAYCLVACYFAG